VALSSFSTCWTSPGRQPPTNSCGVTPEVDLLTFIFTLFNLILFQNTVSVNIFFSVPFRTRVFHSCFSGSPHIVTLSLMPAVLIICSWQRLIFNYRAYCFRVIRISSQWHLRLCIEIASRIKTKDDHATAVSFVIKTKALLGRRYWDVARRGEKVRSGRYTCWLVDMID